MSRLRFVPAGGFLLLAAFAPEIETGCIGGIEYEERWNPAVAANGIPWEIMVPTPPAGQTERAGPGFPMRGPGSLATQPGFASLIRAAETWSNAKIWPSNSPAALCELSTTPSINQIAPGPSGLFTLGSAILAAGGFVPPNGVNSVTLWEDSPGLFGLTSVTRVVVSTAGGVLGRISEFDTVINAGELHPTGTSMFSFVEEDMTVPARWWTTTRSGATFMPPWWGYFDLQGIATHEFGHALGLANSLDDSHADPSQSESPTMFPVRAVHDFVPTTIDWDPGTGPLSTTMHAAGYYGIAGLSARTLAPDDIASIGAAYPSPEYYTETGTVTGTATLNSTPYPGALVTAISKLAPEAQRVSVLTRSNGSFTIRGLYPGEYYLQIRPITASIPATTTTPFVPAYLSDLEMPTFVMLPGGCTTPANYSLARRFDVEMWNDNDVAAEPPMKATLVTVTAATTTGGKDFVLDNPTHALPVLNISSPVQSNGFGGRLSVLLSFGVLGVSNNEFSSRGRIFPMRANNAQALLHFEGNPSSNLWFALSDRLAPVPVTADNQLLMLDTTSSAFAFWPLIAGSNGRAHMQVSIDSNSNPIGWRIAASFSANFPQRTNIYCQAFELTAAGLPVACSNVVNVWRSNP